jgi:hypothetical protein
MECDKRCKVHPNANPELTINVPPNAHYGKWVCSECKKYLSHARHPKNDADLTERQMYIRSYIRMLCQMDMLNDNEMHAVMSMYTVGRNINYAQQELYRKVKHFVDEN